MFWYKCPSLTCRHWYDEERRVANEKKFCTYDTGSVSYHASFDGAALGERKKLKWREHANVQIETNGRKNEGRIFHQKVSMERY